MAAIVAHIHNVRVMWLKATKAESIPEQLDKSTVTPSQAAKALEQSRDALASVLEDAVNSDGKIKGFKPDVTGFVGYLIAHDAHHRGQISMLARQVGHPVSQKTMFGMWEWGGRGERLACRLSQCGRFCCCTTRFPGDVASGVLRTWRRRQRCCVRRELKSRPWPPKAPQKLEGQARTAVGYLRRDLRVRRRRNHP